MPCAAQDYVKAKQAEAEAYEREAEAWDNEYLARRKNRTIDVTSQQAKSSRNGYRKRAADAARAAERGRVAGDPAYRMIRVAKENASRARKYVLLAQKERLAAAWYAAAEAWEAAAGAWEAAAAERERRAAAERERQAAAERERQAAAERERQAAEREWQAAEREWRQQAAATQPIREAVAAAYTANKLAWNAEADYDFVEYDGFNSDKKSKATGAGINAAWAIDSAGFARAQAAEAHLHVLRAQENASDMRRAAGRHSGGLKELANKAAQAWNASAAAWEAVASLE